jgi:hypothetical protein
VKVEGTTTFEDLADLLTKEMTREVQQVRAIFSWVVGQNVREMKFPADVMLNSPMEILRGMQQGKSSYTTLFTLICR